AATGKIVDDYTGRIRAKIRGYVFVPDNVADDAQVQFDVTLLPGGSVLNVRKTKSSGNAAYDDAVERAILRAQPLPLPEDPALFSRFRQLHLTFRPKE
ncbi:MAG: TonB C-terminal domain-containing protein, partial [Gallionellaceae bacterium]|nr:TonB C-terminal domain-containing protein [Gallionellaceae bacterium]